MANKPGRRKNAKTNSFTLFSKIVKFLMISVIVITLIGGLYVTKVVLDIAETAPDVSTAKFLSLSEPSIILDDEGNQMDIIHTDEVRFPIDLEEMGANIINAFISIEDERFEKHKGVDYKRTIGVTLRDVFGRFTGNRDMQGGSTLTQQMIKNTFLTRDQKYERKIKEIFMALEAEKKLTKDQILETYLNSIYLGGKANGVEAAARQYFSKSAKDLNIVEASYIAGATQSPSVYYAFGQNSLANPSKYINRTILVLDALLKNEKITEEEHKIHVDELEIALKPIEEKEAYILDLDAKLASGEIPAEEYNRLSRKAMTGIEFHQQSIISDTYNYEYFTRPVMHEVKKDLKEIKGYTDEEISELINYGGLKIHSTMNKASQDYAQSILADFSNINTRYVDPNTNEDKEAEAAFSAMDYRSGQVKVIIGGRDNTTPSTSNRAYYSEGFTLNVLSPIGSTTKPLLVFSPGLESGALTLGSPANDRQITA
ncbi:MAG: penicillin-binding protein, partial [Clostridium sp.]|nr:penicillin-binding protein [Clostridium sp.]